MRHGIVILPQGPWPEQRRKWQLAEELGFDHAWTYDHLSWRSLVDEPWGAAVPTLTAAAGATTRIRLGLFVASPNFRHPVALAKELGTLDDVAAGRVLLGLGSGGTGFDASVLGQPALSARQRHERFEEFASRLDELLRYEGGSAGPGGFTFDGDWYTARAARMVGIPAQQPRMPFVVAANGPKGMSLAARIGQGWVTTSRDDLEPAARWAALAEAAARFEDALDAAGRAPGSIDRYLSLDVAEPGAADGYSLVSADAYDEAVGRAAELGFTDVVGHWPRRSGIYAGSEDVLSEVAARHLGQSSAR
jgi:alkanesulfonate monooxygenase SsuD/methylene tetrahydromethanopterin reductase-like flavin-dependent oxidoreductase (luciferase family)